jgi:hypothetical protein
VNSAVVSVDLAGVGEATISEVADTGTQAPHIALDKQTRLNG